MTNTTSFSEKMYLAQKQLENDIDSAKAELLGKGKTRKARQERKNASSMYRMKIMYQVKIAANDIHLAI